jgi:FMN-dependent NADH-azoreductase
MFDRFNSSMAAFQTFRRAFMKTILQINASLFSAAGQSSRLADEFVAALRAAHPGVRVIVRDLAKDPIPHLDAERFGAFLSRPEARSPAQQAVLEESDALIDELRRADIVVIAAPMYNFGVPSQLKAWLDHVARAGVTFRYTERGPVGLLTGKRAYVISTRGGSYAGSGNDHETPYLRQFLGFLGIDDVEFVYAEGLAVSEASRQNALEAARAALRSLAPRSLAAAA